ncbi:MAG TPA: DUF4272 domain-containing protein [Verrucomicrobiae bacterium]|nr:DUF4272 domain-containing protein [Verrucomicrobiae bacterium]
MSATKLWAESLNVSGEPDLSPIPDFSQPYARTAGRVAVRAIVLQGVAAVAYDVEAQPIVEWFQEHRIWSEVTPQERAFILGSAHPESEKLRFRWKQEAEWTLLWMIQRVESLGLPTRCCDTRRLVDQIIPPLGDNIENFISRSELRSPGALLAEDDRTYDLWCYALGAQRRGESLPADLNLGVLRERRYAFEWLDGRQDWDDVTCDS